MGTDHGYVLCLSVPSAYIDVGVYAIEIVLELKLGQPYEMYTETSGSVQQQNKKVVRWNDILGVERMIEEMSL